MSETDKEIARDFLTRILVKPNVSIAWILPESILAESALSNPRSSIFLPTSFSEKCLIF